jgi:hypothetical protein
MFDLSALLSSTLNLTRKPFKRQSENERKCKKEKKQEKMETRGG